VYSLAVVARYVERGRLRAANAAGTGVHEEGDNQTVETQDFSENENQNHADEESWLLGRTAHTGITDDTNGETSGQPSQTDGETSTELNEAGEERCLLAKVVGDEDGDDKAIDTNDTSHNNGNDVLDDQVRSEDTHGADTDTRFRGAIGSTEAGEDDGRRAAHSPEERGIDGAEIRGHCDWLVVMASWMCWISVGLRGSRGAVRESVSAGGCDG